MVGVLGMSNPKKAISGGGHREYLICVVPDCGKKFRRDQLNTRHYFRVVATNNDGKPLRPDSLQFNQINNEETKNHTKCFYENELDPSEKVHKKEEKEKLTPFQRMAVWGFINIFLMLPIF